jgi:hypothetical protein
MNKARSSGPFFVSMHELCVRERQDAVFRPGRCARVELCDLLPITDVLVCGEYLVV